MSPSKNDGHSWVVEQEFEKTTVPVVMVNPLRYRLVQAVGEAGGLVRKPSRFSKCNA
jgi:hypothetical protein